MANDRVFNKRTILLTAASLIGVIVLVAVIYRFAMDREIAARRAIELEELASRQVVDTTAYVQWNGKTYKPRNNLTVILFMGVDKTTAELDAIKGFRDHGQTDFLMLIVADHDEKTISRLLIDRDTLLDISTFGMFGNPAGTMVERISLQHSFGDGREISCGLVASAVSKWLMGVRIEHYIAMSLDGIPTINDSVGGITVTLDDDYTAYRNDWTAGSEVTLHGAETSLFVRSRYYIGESSNESRMKRQNQYLEKLAEKMKSTIYESPSFVGTLFNTLGADLVTDMTRGRIINEANRALDYQISAMVQLPGEHIVDSDGFVEFHPERSAVEQWVMDTFCSPVEGGGQTYQ